MTHIHINNGKTFLFAPISEGLTEWRIHILKSAWLLTWGIGNDYIKLPPGNWQIIGKASVLLEVQAKEIVEPSYNSISVDVARLELNSLLRSLNMQPETTLILQLIVS